MPPGPTHFYCKEVFNRPISWFARFRMTSRSLGHRAPLLWIVAPLMAGLVIGKAGLPLASAWLLAGAAGLAATAIVCAWRAPRGMRAALAGSMVLAGAATYALHRPRIAAWDHLPPREARLVLRVDRVFPTDDPKRAAGLATVHTADVHLRELAAQRVYFSLSLPQGVAPPQRSAVVRAVGVLAALPRDPPADSFDSYLVNAGINFRLGRGRVLGIERPANAYYRFCDRAAARFSAILGLGVEAKRPQLVGVLRAMLLGQQHELSEEQTLAFRRSGTMHVFSISGLHIGVIAAGLHALLVLVRLPTAVRFIAGLVALWLYVDITGAAPSAVRAFVMVALIETSFVLRVPRNPLAALAASALLVLLVAPLQLFSASFQMSYGIVAALLLLGLPLADRWQARFALFRDLPKATWRWPHHAADAAWRAILAATAIGLAASLVSAVTTVMFFQLFTPGALLANLWLIPASTAVILFGFVSLLAGLVGVPAVSVLANHAAVLLLWALEAGIRGFAAAPATWFTATFRTPWLGGATLAALLLALALGYAQRWRGLHRGYWLPFAVVALAFVVGVKFG